LPKRNCLDLAVKHFSRLTYEFSRKKYEPPVLGGFVFNYALVVTLRGGFALVQACATQEFE